MSSTVTPAKLPVWKTSRWGEILLMKKRLTHWFVSVFIWLFSKFWDCSFLFLLVKWDWCLRVLLMSQTWNLCSCRCGFSPKVDKMQRLQKNCSPVVVVVKKNQSAVLDRSSHCWKNEHQVEPMIHSNVSRIQVKEFFFFSMEQVLSCILYSASSDDSLVFFNNNNNNFSTVCWI